MLFDTHAHYDAEQFDPDRDEILAGLHARKSVRAFSGEPVTGGELVVGISQDLGDSLDPYQMTAAGTREVMFNVFEGLVKPDSCGPWREEELEDLRQMAKHPKVVAIGEIGLDYYWEENPPKELQQQVFRAQMALAEELDLPVIVHDREAHGDSLAVVREFPRVRGVFHCFSGSAEMAGELVRLGWLISFTGVLTYKNARRAVEAARAVPLERIMIETDSPYMAPVPHRGTRNDSGYVRYVCERLAEIKGVPPADCAAITLETGKRFFRIP